MSWPRAIGAGALVILIFATPTLAFEEFWGGMPMIDQGTGAWRIPAAIVAVTFVAGGAIAGRRLPQARTAGLGAGTVAAVVLVAADIVRRLAITHQALTWPVAGLWGMAGAAAVASSAAGGLWGRSRGWSRRRRRVPSGRQ